MLAGWNVAVFITRDGLIAVELQSKFCFARDEENRDRQVLG